MIEKADIRWKEKIVKRWNILFEFLSNNCRKRIFKRFQYIYWEIHN